MIISDRFNSSSSPYLSAPASYFSFVAIAVVAAVLVACSSGPQTGVRSTFEEQRVTSVAIAPFYAQASFGMEREQMEETQQEYQRVAAEALRQQGFKVLDTPELRQHLTTAGHWDAFVDGIHLRQALPTYFEVSTSNRSNSIEIQTVRKLAEDGAFPVESILFGEVVYHTQGICRTQPSAYTPYAQLTVAPSAPSKFPRPCVTSHFQAKLVDVRTGDTMWFNRMFVETHAGQIDHTVSIQNITDAVRNTLIGDGGITPLSPADTTHAESR